MTWFKITIAYDGADFCGWQVQDAQRTVQGVFEEAWHTLTGETVSVTASGRTDAGVHADGQVVGVETATTLDGPTLCRGLNACLPEDVVVRNVQPVGPGFHATTDAVQKRYRYLIFNSRCRPLFWRRRAWHVPVPLDWRAMQEAGSRLVGTHDFACFQSVGSPRQSTVRTVLEVAVHNMEMHNIDVHNIHVQGGRGGEGAERGERAAQPDAIDDWERQALLAIDVVGDGFLYHMVRAIAGTLVRAGRRRLSAAEMEAIVASRDRSRAGQTAPAYGLTLVAVAYPAECSLVSQPAPGDYTE